MLSFIAVILNSKRADSSPEQASFGEVQKGFQSVVNELITQPGEPCYVSCQSFGREFSVGQRSPVWEPCCKVILKTYIKITIIF